ncbi:VOC family protein [Paenibacillaceae bacterium WGS1546]|uniref:VOC family protein n=1 Tax=Cohnella sp. WGS1546 TaxID=3366810 RepID=UPI00372D0A14
MYKPGIAIWYNVKELEKSVAFYTEGLGFTLDFKDEEKRMAIVTTNTKECFIGLAEAETVVPVTSSTVFEVEDIEQAVTTLQARGVQFTGEIETIPDFVKLATFNDPDGHCFELSQTLIAS